MSRRNTSARCARSGSIQACCRTKPGTRSAGVQHTHSVVPAFALGHAHVWCGGLTQVLLGDSRIGNLCDFYCGTSALAEVSACWCKLTGRWVGSGIVVSIKGGGAHRMHG